MIDAEGDIPYRFDLTNERGLVIGSDPSHVYRKQSLVRLESVRFGTAAELGGTLYLPSSGTGPRPAVAMLHGSGPQDRNGYASIIALIGLRLARAGVVVLTFDKRGVGESRGRWESASFDDLADDVRHAMRYLASRSEVDGRRIGLAGSSQAGWIAAKAIAAGASPAFTMLVGAARRVAEGKPDCFESACSSLTPLARMALPGNDRTQFGSTVVRRVGSALRSVSCMETI